MRKEVWKLGGREEGREGQISNAIARGNEGK
jgi:hypothetical protein